MLYAIDDHNESILRIDPQSGTASVLVTQQDFAQSLSLAISGDSRALAGEVPGSVDLEAGLVADREGHLFAVSEKDPDSVFRIDISTGQITIVVSTPPLVETDDFATRAPNGDLIIADDGGFPNELREPIRLFRINPVSGDVSVFLSEQEIEDVVDTDISLEAGMAFDSRGNFFIVEKKVRAHSAV